MIKIKRIIHPLGQGAFYSEEISYNDKIFNIVYDCGSLNKVELKQCIDKFANNCNDIDMLFISHFDKDHVNGIEYLKSKCQIKCVVMPLIDDNDKCYYILESNFDKQITDIFKKDYWGKGTIVKYVKTITNRGEGQPQYIGNISHQESHESGDPFVICNRNREIIWIYIPYNFDFKNRNNKLLQNLKLIGLTVSDIINTSYTEQERATINKLYKGCPKKGIRGVCTGGSNHSSLIVYSGNIFDSDIPKKCRIEECFWSCCTCHKSINPIINVGCLYTGDTSLKQKGLLRKLQAYLGKYSNTIDRLQIPHHGSKDNFKDAVFCAFINIRLCFASFGDLNQYGHPDISVLNEILKARKYFIGVTNNTSKETQRITIY